MPSPTDASVATSRERELAEQRRWRLRPAYAQVDWFTRLVDAEFAAPADHAARAAVSLQRLLAHAREAVPHFRQSLTGLSARDLARFTPADLPRLPVLERREVRDRGDLLRSRRLPQGERMAGATKTSGTTGQPVEIWHTANSLRLQGLLGQRQLRWFRFDPAAPYAAIKTAAALPRDDAGRELEPGVALRLETWPGLGEYFETGAYLCLSSMSPIEVQLEWLLRERPRHLLARAAMLEHLALAAPDNGLEHFDALLAIADQVTPDMRRRIERSLGAPLHQNYGLNEFGLVAVRCPEAGRYHVHGEHCLFEIVDADGLPCAPGEQGRLLLTCVTNPAMPLVRYDSGDLARVADGPCPCGRTLPAFAEIVGRRLHLASLPAGVYAQESALRELLEALPRTAWRGITQYQIRHARAGHFTLVLGTDGPPDRAFTRDLRDAWAAHADRLPLHLAWQPHIPCDASGKYQIFVSEHYDDPATP